MTNRDKRHNFEKRYDVHEPNLCYMCKYYEEQSSLIGICQHPNREEDRRIAIATTIGTCFREF